MRKDSVDDRIQLYYNSIRKWRYIVLEEKKLVIRPQKYTGESKVISMRLPIDMLVEVDRVARETGRTRNEIMQTCLEFALENMIIEE